MIELISTRRSADCAELKVSCAGAPNDQLLRFLQAKVSLEHLLPAQTVVSSLHHVDAGAAHLAWRVQWQQLADHIALIRTTFPWLSSTML